MSLLITILIYMLILGVIYWLITSVIPLPPPFRTIALVIFAILVIVVLLDMLGGVGLGLPRLAR